MIVLVCVCSYEDEGGKPAKAKSKGKKKKGVSAHLLPLSLRFWLCSLRVFCSFAHFLSVCLRVCRAMMTRRLVSTHAHALAIHVAHK